MSPQKAFDYVRYCLGLALFGLNLIGHATVSARACERSDLDFMTTLHHQKTIVHADGRTRHVLRLRQMVLRESGKEQLKTFSYSYDASTTEVKLESAQMWDPDSNAPGKQVTRAAHAVEPSAIEDKPLASNWNGFGEMRQLLIAFPKVEVGSERDLTLSLDVKPAIPGFFGDKASINFVDAFLWEIESEKPIYYKAFDPKKQLVISKPTSHSKAGKPFYSLTIQNKRPLLDDAIQETKAHYNYPTVPQISISNHPNWNALSAPLRPDYEAVIQAPLPTLYQSIVTAAKQQREPLAQIGIVMAKLNEKINYMGDWRTHQGKFIPRPLETVVRTGYGDCKDFSAATAAMLRALGLQADVAVIERGRSIWLSPLDRERFKESVPNSQSFNHAIVRVTLENGRRHWIDPTNFLSFAKGILEDIADRPALAITDAQGVIEWTPPLLPTDQQVTVIHQKNLADPEKSILNTSLELKGRAAMALTGATLRSSPKSIEREVLGLIENPDKALEWKVQLPDLTSRIVEDLPPIRIEAILRETPVQTNLGPGQYLEPSSLSPLFEPFVDRVSDYYLGVPQKNQITASFTHVQIDRNAFLPCSIDSPWFKATRSIQKTASGFDEMRQLEIKQRLIPAAILSSADFQGIQKNLKQCMGPWVMVYEPTSQNLSKLR